MKISIPKRKKQEDNSRQHQLFFILPFACLSLLLLLPSTLATSACGSSAQKCRCPDGSWERVGTIEILAKAMNNPNSCCYNPNALLHKPNVRSSGSTPRYAQLQPVYSLEYYSARYSAQQAAEAATAPLESKYKPIMLTPIMINGEYVKKTLPEGAVTLKPVDLNAFMAQRSGINITELLPDVNMSQVDVPLTDQQMGRFLLTSSTYVYHLFI